MNKIVVDAVVEIPMNTKNKFEVDKRRDKIKLDRVLYSSMNYPSEYGFIEETLELDGDPLDILVISSEPTFPGCIVPARVVGNLRILDSGKPDNKIISVVDVDPRFDYVQELNDLSDFTLREIVNFFENYKTLQGIEVKVLGYEDKEAALKVIETCRERLKEAKKKEQEKEEEKKEEEKKEKSKTEKE